MAKIAPKTAIFAIFGTTEVKEVIMKTLLSSIGERNAYMNTVLKSDTFTAVAKSIEIKIATEQLRDLPAVGTGETNHDINIKCCNIYDNIASMLNSYCNASAGPSRIYHVYRRCHTGKLSIPDVYRKSSVRDRLCG